ncbi:transcriptional regulator BetI [Shimia sp.]|uniref:choline-binding transcriptional repressor BetI n=1 Tax=Shimia sp. TaxID=1954381 RepID=UPI003298204F
MTRSTISEIRREELIQATIAAIYEQGFADLTVSRIAKDAQVSTGSIHYYFGGKEALLEATMLHLLNALKTAHHSWLKDAKTPEERLHAVVQANFDGFFLSKETCRVWTQFWAFAPYHPKLARLHRINRARVKSNVMFSLRELVPSQDLTVKTNAIQGYMDGVWVQIAQSAETLNLPDLQSEATLFVNQTIWNGSQSRM